MKKLPLIIDCDPGIDDALALLLLYKHKEKFDIKLITSTAGNCSIETTTNNVLYFLDKFFPESKVGKGSPTPIVKINPLSAEDVHGASGLGSVKVQQYDQSNIPSSIEVMRDVLVNSEEKITLLTIGAMTNVARLLITYPETRNKIERIYSMIGSISGKGNIEPYAEFNAYFDPEALDIVTKCGIPMVINPLELARDSKLPKATLEQYIPQNEIQQFVSNITASLNEFNDPINIGIYDAHSAVALINPDLYEFHPCDINIYTNFEVRGKCVLTPNPSSKNYYQTLKNAKDANDYILNELFTLE
jgi:non-specific riboncleoside hydrolase